MPIFTANFLISVILLSALVMMLKVNKLNIDDDRSGYFQIIFGIMILSLTEIGRTYQASGLMAGIPFLSETVFFNLLHWILVITGVTLLLAGVSNWLPLFQAYRKYNAERVHRLEYLKKVEQLVGVESRTDAILAGSLKYMTEHFPVSSGVVLKYSSSNNLLYLASSIGQSKIKKSNFYRLNFNETGWKRYCDGVPANSSGMIRGFASCGTKPDILLPISVNERPVGLFVLWLPEKETLPHEVKMILNTSADIIGRELGALATRLERDSLRNIGTWQAELSSEIASIGDTRGRITTLSAHVRRIVKADFVSMVLLDKRKGQYQRFTSSSAGSLLIETLVKEPDSTLIMKMLKTQGSWSTGKMTEDDNDSLDSFLKMQSPKSLALIAETNFIGSGLLMITSTSVDAWKKTELKKLEMIRPVLLQLISDECTRHTTEKLQRRSNRTSALLSIVTSGTGISQISKYASRMLADELGVKMVRVSSVSDDSKFLDSKALEVPGSLAGMVPENGSLVLSVMPHHERMLVEGHPVQVRHGKDGAEIQEVEARQLFVPPIDHLLIVPIAKGSQVWGVIDIAETESSTRTSFDEDEIRFVMLVADLLSIAYADRNETSTQSTDINLGRETTNELKSSIDGIIGSIEMLRSQPVAGNEQTSRQLSIIDRSARRMGRSLEIENEPVS